MFYYIGENIRTNDTVSASIPTARNCATTTLPYIREFGKILLVIFSAVRIGHLESEDIRVLRYPWQLQQSTSTCYVSKDDDMTMPNDPA